MVNSIDDLWSNYIEKLKRKLEPTPNCYDPRVELAIIISQTCKQVREKSDQQIRNMNLIFPHLTCSDPVNNKLIDYLNGFRTSMCPDDLYRQVNEMSSRIYDRSMKEEEYNLLLENTIEDIVH